MKVEFFEGKFGGNINLIPESIEEASQLVRMGLNAKSEPITMRVNFNEKGIDCDIHIDKVKPSVQSNSITNKNRK